jgi:hypothetical protein
MIFMGGNVAHFHDICVSAKDRSLVSLDSSYRDEHKSHVGLPKAAIF